MHPKADRFSEIYFKPQFSLLGDRPILLYIFYLLMHVVRMSAMLSFGQCTFGTLIHSYNCRSRDDDGDMMRKEGSHPGL